MADVPYLAHRADYVQSSGTTLTTLMSIPFSDVSNSTDCTIGMVLEVDGNDRTNGHIGSYLKKSAFKVASEVLSHHTTVDLHTPIEDDADWAVTVDDDGSGNILVRVQGGAGDTVDWAGRAWLTATKS